MSHNDIFSLVDKGIMSENCDIMSLSTKNRSVSGRIGADSDFSLLRLCLIVIIFWFIQFFDIVQVCWVFKS